MKMILKYVILDSSVLERFPEPWFSRPNDSWGRLQTATSRLFGKVVIDMNGLMFDLI